ALVRARDRPGVVRRTKTQMIHRFALRSPWGRAARTDESDSAFDLHPCPGESPIPLSKRRRTMRSLFLSLALGAAALFGTLATPSNADAQWRRSAYYAPYYSSYYSPYYSSYSYPAYSYYPGYSYYY